jgi:mono/diheme cytochrome c family protein
MRRALIVLSALLTAGCGLDMSRQARPAPERSADLWPTGPAVLPPQQGAVAFGQSQPQDGPPHMSLALLERGQDRYAIYCMPCHGVRGHGDGPVVQRGFPAPPAFGAARLVSQPIGHFHDVAANGFGLMYGFGDRVPPADLWAIAAYVRALQMADGHGAGRP